LKAVAAALKKAKKDKELLIQAGGNAVTVAGPASAGPKTVEEYQAEIDRLKKRKQEIIAAKPQLETAFAIAEAKPVNAHLMRRGDPENLGDEIPGDSPWF